MIQGDGFFVTARAPRTSTPAPGRSTSTATGKLVTPDGGVAAGLDGRRGRRRQHERPGRRPVDALRPDRRPEADHDRQRSAGNLPPDAATGTRFQTAVNVRQPGRRAEGALQLHEGRRRPTPGPSTSSTPNGDARLVTGATVAFDAAGALDHPGRPGTLAAVHARRPRRSPAGPARSRIDLVRADPVRRRRSTVVAPEPERLRAGLAAVLPVGDDGTITGVFSNGLRQPLGQLALASFNNPSGLEKAGGSTFRVGVNSGVGGRRRGRRRRPRRAASGALEMSNVDLAQEFTGLIVAQRGFQANSRVITSSDEILQDLVNLKR